MDFFIIYTKTFHFVIVLSLICIYLFFALLQVKVWRIIET